MLSILFVGCSAREPEKTGKEGQPIPNFHMLLSDSVTHFWSSSIKADSPTVFVYFWTTCPYSRAEIQDLLDDIDNMEDIQFYFVTPNSYKQLEHYVTAYHLHGYKNLSVGMDTSQFFSKYFDNGAVPLTAIYGKDHRLKAAYVGQISSTEVKTYAKK